MSCISFHPTHADKMEVKDQNIQTKAVEIKDQQVQTETIAQDQGTCTMEYVTHNGPLTL